MSISTLSAEKMLEYKVSTTETCELAIRCKAGVSTRGPQEIPGTAVGRIANSQLRGNMMQASCTRTSPPEDFEQGDSIKL
jgi:hypothetical protein